MGKRSKIPKWIKRGEGKVPIGKGTNQPMNFKHGRAMKPRPDTGKKITKDRSYHKSR